MGLVRLGLYCLDLEQSSFELVLRLGPSFRVGLGLIGHHACCTVGIRV